MSKASFALMDSENVNNLVIKAEPIEYFEFGNNPLGISRNTYMNCTKLEPEIIKQVENLGVVEHNIFNHTHCKISDTASNKSKEISARQSVVSVNTTNSFTKKGIDEWSEIVHDDWTSKREKVNLKEEGVLENEVKFVDCTSKEIKILKSENSNTNSEIVKWPGVVYDDWKIKREEIDLRKEDQLENETSGRCIQEKCEFYKKHEDNVGEFQAKQTDSFFEVDNLFRCDKCKYRTHTKRYLTNHLLRHKKSEGFEFFECDKCEYRSRYKCHLKTHALRHKNPEVHWFKCDECEYQTHIKGNLQRHFLKHKKFEEVKLFGCDKCEYRTHIKGGLKIHLLRHKKPEEVELFRCNKCEYQTLYRSELKRHAVRHKNPEVHWFKCDNCEYRTHIKGTLKIHVFRHKKPEEVELFGCIECEYRTHIKSNLTRHLLRHKKAEEVELFACNKCEYRTRIKSNIRRHLLRHAK